MATGSTMIGVLKIAISLIVSTALFAWEESVAFPSGAPPDVCATNLLPIHGGNQPVTGVPAPYSVTASSSTYSPNKPITVVIKGRESHSFKGFVIQAQDATTHDPIYTGEWNGAQAKELPCAAATHTSPSAKTKVELTWTPKGSGQVIFVATVVENFTTFYADIKSTTRVGSGTSTAGSSSSQSSTVHKLKPIRRPTSGQSISSISSGDGGSSSGQTSSSASNSFATPSQSSGNQFGSFANPMPSFGNEPQSGSGNTRFDFRDQTSHDSGAAPNGFFQFHPQQQHQPSRFPFDVHSDDRLESNSQVFDRFPSNDRRFQPGRAPHFPLPWHNPHHF